MTARFFSNYHVKKIINITKNVKIVKQNGKILQVSTNIQFSHYFSPYQQSITIFEVEPEISITCGPV